LIRPTTIPGFILAFKLQALYQFLVNTTNQLQGLIVDSKF